MFDILVVIPTFDLHVKPAITLVWADLIYNSVASPLWGIFGVAGMGPHITHPACLAWCGPSIAFHIDQERSVQRRAIARWTLSMWPLPLPGFAGTLRRSSTNCKEREAETWRMEVHEKSRAWWSVCVWEADGQANTCGRAGICLVRRCPCLISVRWNCTRQHRLMAMTSTGASVHSWSGLTAWIFHVQTPVCWHMHLTMDTVLFSFIRSLITSLQCSWLIIAWYLLYC